MRLSFGVLERQVAQIGRLVDDLLDVARIAEGKIELRIQRIDLIPMLNTAIEGSRELLRSKSDEFVADLPDRPIYIDADPARVVQIAQNLLNNAAKYTPPGGRIGLTVSWDDTHAIIAVSDTGIGISAENLPALFSIFSQLPSGKSYAQGGLGIGLSLVRALSEAHGGAATATSLGASRGSEFTVRLPLAPVQETAVKDERMMLAAAPGSRRRVLVVDDSEDAVFSLCMLLESDGFETRSASTGNGAISMASKADVVLLDIGLPDMDGYDVARQIRADPRNSGVLLVAVTGWSQNRDREAAAGAGFDHHLTKPVDYARLLEILNTAG